MDQRPQPHYIHAMTQLDALGLLCPLPVLKARKRLSALASGDVLEVLTDDPAAVIDIPHYCHEAGHELLSQEQTGAQMRWRIRKG
jgi:tRNA 2-thiouridine synthesizing protein A